MFDDTHGLTAAAVGEPVNVLVDPTHTSSVPVIVGGGLIVTLVIDDVVEQPLLFVTVTV